MNARTLTGLALAAALRKAAMPAMSGALRWNGDRLRVAVDAGEERRLSSPPLRWRGGEGSTSSVSQAELPQGERETASNREAEPVSSPLPGGGASVAVAGDGGLSLEITLAVENLFAREFGTLDAGADPVLAPAIERLRRKSP